MRECGVVAMDDGGGSREVEITIPMCYAVYTASLHAVRKCYIPDHVLIRAKFNVVVKKHQHPQPSNLDIRIQLERGHDDLD